MSDAHDKASKEATGNEAGQGQPAPASVVETIKRTVVLTRDKQLLGRYGGLLRRINVGQDHEIVLPDPARQRAGFELDEMAARRLVQVCPLYKFKKE